MSFWGKLSLGEKSQLIVGVLALIIAVIALPPVIGWITSLRFEGIPKEALEALDDWVRQEDVGGFNFKYNITLQELAQYPENFSSFRRINEVWCVTINNPIYFYGLSFVSSEKDGPYYKFLLFKEGNLWNTRPIGEENLYASNETTWYRVGCS